MRSVTAWVRDHLLATVIGVVLATAATVFVVVPLKQAKARACETDINPNGAVSQYAGIRIVKREVNRNAFVVDEGVFHHIPDGQTYIHNASYFPVQYNVDEVERKRLRKEDGPDAESPTGTQPRVGPKVLKDNYLLRPEDGKRWWQVVDGQRVRIARGRTFACLTKRYLVWDRVSPDVVTSFPRHRSLRRARCRR